MKITDGQFKAALIAAEYYLDSLNFKMNKIELYLKELREEFKNVRKEIRKLKSLGRL